MRWLISLVLAMVMVTPALAGEDPYIAIVGNDCIKHRYDSVLSAQEGDCNGTPFYVSEKYQQFMFDQEDFSVPVCDPLQTSFPEAYSQIGPNSELISYGGGCEQFRSRNAIKEKEICWTRSHGERMAIAEDQYRMHTNLNSLVPAGKDGWYEWYVRLPKAPTGQINLVLQCGVLKPNSYPFLGYDSVELCAAETGEMSGGLCVRTGIRRGENPIKKWALPKITAIAYPGYFSDFEAFNLTALRNPGTYNPYSARSVVNGEAAQVLDGSDGARIMLKSCMDKTILVKMPVSGQVTPGGVETALQEGDIIYVRMDIPLANTVDIFCHEQSLKVMGIGLSPYTTY